MRGSALVPIVLLGVLVLLGLGACGGDEDGPVGSLGDAPDGATAPAPNQDDAAAPSSDGGVGGVGDRLDASPLNDANTVDAAPGQTWSGEATWYDAHGQNACGLPNPADFLVAAMNKTQYTKANCGKCVRVKGPKGAVTVKLVDLCPGCKNGSLDLSEEAFQRISPLSAGRVKITWSFTACP